ncbi:MAG TPA: ZIP family metal transporter [Candidatus Bathyarchaeia archaeon]|nr:ZIP family metal transporter [Candidatus Bathyarchaeia archaeon]
MIDYWQLLLLGSIAGFTIFLGLPLAVLQNVSSKKKGFLNAIAIGILVFLIIDVFGHAWDSVGNVTKDTFSGKVAVSTGVSTILALFGGLAIGLLGLVFYEERYMKKNLKQKWREAGLDSSVASSGGEYQHQLQLLQEGNAYRLSMMIAMGIGFHNFSEGLAIGQSYASGAIGLAIILIIGFGAHNATEGFGIAGPLTGLVKKPRIRFLILAGLVGGGPTFVGTVLGSLWTSAITSVFFLSIAGGALIYVSMLMYNSGRKQTTNDILMLGIFVGLCAGFVTDLIVTLGGA